MRYNEFKYTFYRQGSDGRFLHSIMFYSIDCYLLAINFSFRQKTVAGRRASADFFQHIFTRFLYQLHRTICKNLSKSSHSAATSSILRRSVGACAASEWVRVSYMDSLLSSTFLSKQSIHYRKTTRTHVLID